MLGEIFQGQKGPTGRYLGALTLTHGSVSIKVPGGFRIEKEKCHKKKRVKAGAGVRSTKLL